MKKLFLLFFICCAMIAAGQTHYTQKVYAFSQKQGDGSLKHFIYIEMPGDSIPVWDSAVIKDKRYVVHASPVETMPVTVGQRKSDKRMVVLKTPVSGRIFMLDFDAVNEGKNISAVPANAAAVVLTGKLGGRKITYKILTEIALEDQE